MHLQVSIFCCNFVAKLGIMYKREYIAGIVTIVLIVALLVLLGVNMYRNVQELRTTHLNGVPITYLVKGKAQGKPVVLLHGNGGKHEDLRMMTDQLAAAGYLVWAPDSRGQGANPPLEEYHYADMAEDMYQFVKFVVTPYYSPFASGTAWIRKLTQYASSVVSGSRLPGQAPAEAYEIKPAVFGWSDGGIIALMTEVKHPDTWSAIITSGANIDPDCGVWDLKEERVHPKDSSALYRMMLWEPNMTVEDMQKIQCPCLICAGENDLISLEHTHLIGDNIPEGEVYIVPNADHGSHIYNNSTMGRIVLQYLQKIDY